jgi:divalent metal cation (Fe/Co/Zn/Cd) transporter
MIVVHPSSRLIIAPSDSSKAKSDDIWDARSPAITSTTVALETLAIWSWQAWWSRFPFSLPNLRAAIAAVVMYHGVHIFQDFLKGLLFRIEIE